MLLSHKGSHRSRSPERSEHNLLGQHIPQLLDQFPSIVGGILATQVQTRIPWGLPATESPLRVMAEP